MVSNNSTNNFGISRYIVSQTPGRGSYTSIQSAINAANAAGGGTIYVEPGSYTEDLTFFDKIELVGSVGIEDAGNIQLTGTHTPPASGSISIKEFQLNSSTDIFNSTAPGSGVISLFEVTFNVTDGYVFNLPNWTGSLKINDAGSIGTNDGVVNNTGGATVFTNNCQIGAGNTRTFTANGNVRMDLTYIVCPVSLSGSGTNSFNFAIFGDTLTVSDNASVSVFLGNFINASNPALVTTSSQTVVLNQCSIASSIANAIQGTGSVELVSVGYTQESGIQNTITVNYGSEFETGTAFLRNLSFDRGATTISSDGQLIIGDSTGVPKIATLTAGSNVSIVNGNGSITINASSGGLTWNAATTDTNMVAGNAYIAANNVSLVTLTLPDPQQIGDMLQIVGFGAGGWKIAQNAGQTIHFGSSATTTGVAGFLQFVDQYDCITLVAVNSNQWVAYGAIGNITVS